MNDALHDSEIVRMWIAWSLVSNTTIGVVGSLDWLLLLLQPKLPTWLTSLFFSDVGQPLFWLSLCL